jgi:hypothetical protein
MPYVVVDPNGCFLQTATSTFVLEREGASEYTSPRAARRIAQQAADHHLTYMDVILYSTIDSKTTSLLDRIQPRKPNQDA